MLMKVCVMTSMMHIEMETRQKTVRKRRRSTKRRGIERRVVNEQCKLNMLIWAIPLFGIAVWRGAEAGWPWDHLVACDTLPAASEALWGPPNHLRGPLIFLRPTQLNLIWGSSSSFSAPSFSRLQYKVWAMGCDVASAFATLHMGLHYRRDDSLFYRKISFIELFFPIVFI